MIDIKKTYKTRNGLPVKIKKITNGYVYGFFKTNVHGWAETMWYENGDFKGDFEECELDLIEVKDEK